MQVPLLNALKTFTVSAQRLNFTKASEDLLVSPSAISHQIKILEEYLGCKLFLRKNRSLELTEEGLFLFNRLQRPFYEINQALSELRMPHGKSRINLSLRPFVSSMWFTKQLADLWRKHPGIEINLIHSLQVPDFFRDNINFAIVWGKQGDWPHLATLPIIAGNLTPVCSPAYLQEHGEIKVAADLNQHILIHEENHLGWQQWLYKATGKEMQAGKGFHRLQPVEHLRLRFSHPHRRRARGSRRAAIFVHVAGARQPRSWRVARHQPDADPQRFADSEGAAEPRVSSAVRHR